MLRRLSTVVDRPAASDSALGDWYVNRLVLRRQPVLLITSETSRLTFLTPAREVRHLPELLPTLVGDRLNRLCPESSFVDREVAAMQPVVIAKTTSRSVLGSMVEFAKAIPYYLDMAEEQDRPLDFIEDNLGRFPCHVGGEWFYPIARANEQLQNRWGAELNRGPFFNSQARGPSAAAEWPIRKRMSMTDRSSHRG